MENTIVEEEIETKDEPCALVCYNEIRGTLNGDPVKPKTTHVEISDKVNCPDCGKLITKKTLAYTHKLQCKKTNLINYKKPENITNTVNVKRADNVKNEQKHRYSHISFF